MEFQQWYSSIPVFTKFYLISVFSSTFCLTYLQGIIPLAEYFILNYDLIFKHFHIWRLLTNFFIVGKFSFSFMFFVIMLNNNISKLEKDSKANRRYSEFLMLIVYICALVIGISMIMRYVFGINENYSLCFEFLFALMYIESKRDPDTNMIVWLVVVKHSYVPYAFLFISLITGGDIISDIIGIVAGHCYYYLKDIAPLHYNIHILITPRFLERYFDGTKTRTIPQERQRLRHNVPEEPFFRGATTQSSTSYRAPGSTIEGNQFQPFNTQGARWGNE